jgi:NADH:ubiquinone oxidoreductase subunit 6 (subunit J)
VPLIGALPQPITSAPLVLFVYLVLILLLGSALASVLLRNTVYAIAAFAAGLVLVALLYLAIAPFLLVAVQLLVFTTVSAAFLIGLLRATTGLRTSSVGRLSPEWIVGAAVAAVIFALLALVLGATSWPVQVCCGLGGENFGAVLGNTYAVGLAVLAVILGSAALGSGLLLAAPTLPSPRGGGSTTSRSPGGGGSRTVRR